jgi:hypothetical protein
MSSTILAHIKDKKENYQKVTTSNTDIYEIPDNLDNAIEYQADLKIGDGEWFCLSDFSKMDYCLSPFKSKLNSVDYVAFQRENFEKISFLICLQSDTWFIQKVTKTKLLKDKVLLNFGDVCEYTEIKNSIAISFPEAIYCTSSDKLYFKSLSNISTVFVGVSELYRAAKDPEVQTFLSLDFIQLNNDFSADKVKIANRKRIAMAMDTLNSFSKEDRKKVFKYIKDYCPNIVDNKKFKISDENTLKQLLYGIEQRYYTTAVGGQKRCANSVIDLDD